MKRLFKDVSMFEVIVVLGFFALMVMSCVAEARGNHPPPPVDEPVGNIDVTVDSDPSITTNLDTSLSASSEASVSTDGNTQQLRYTNEDNPVKAIINSTSADSDPGSTAPCLESRRSVSVWMVGVGGKTKLNEDCWAEYQKDAHHRRILMTARALSEMGGPEAGYEYLCSEMGLGCPEPNLYGGGSKESIDPDYVQSLEEEVGAWRERAIHGDILK